MLKPAIACILSVFMGNTPGLQMYALFCYYSHLSPRMPWARQRKIDKALWKIRKRWRWVIQWFLAAGKWERFPKRASEGLESWRRHMCFLVFVGVPWDLLPHCWEVAIQQKGADPSADAGDLQWGKEMGEMHFHVLLVSPQGRIANSHDPIDKHALASAVSLYLWRTPSWVLLWRAIFWVNYVFPVLDLFLGFLFPCFFGFLLFPASLLLCFSASLLVFFKISAFLLLCCVLLCFSLLLCFFGFLLYLASLLLCFFAVLLFWFPCVFAFQAKTNPKTDYINKL